MVTFVVFLSRAQPSRSQHTLASAAMMWKWHEEVPDNLRPRGGLWVRAADVERWDGWDFIMLDHWSRTTGRTICRYAAVPTYVWNINLQGKGSWHADVPHPGLLLMVREAKWRGRQKGNLVHLDDNTLRVDLFWRVSIWGCYCYAPCA